MLLEDQCAADTTKRTMNSKTIVLALLGLVLMVTAIVIIAMAVQPAETTTGKADCPVDYAAQPPVILISLDGFRASYRERGLTPVLQQLADEGVTAPFMKPSYPTVTFPNHYTIVTGLYPESHGIIANKFYDPEFQATFSLGSEESLLSRWWGGEPMWNTVTRQGLKSATYFWPGSDAPIGGQYPTYWFPYNTSVPYEDRVSQVLEWVTMPADERPAWITLYFDEPDHTGHQSGPDSDEVNAQLERMDGFIEMLVSGLTDVGLLDCVNVIVLADHGMASGGPSFVIQLEDYIPDVYDSAYTYTGAFTRIDPKDESDEVKYAMMKNLSCQRPDLRQYEKAGLPTRFHFSNNRRIEDIVLDLDAGRYGSVSSSWYNMGNHGYDNYFTAMNALFLARGPAFKVGVEVEPFQNIQLYNLMCYLVGVEPAPNNGTVGALNSLLLDPQPVEELNPEEPPSASLYPDDAALLDRLGLSGCSGDLQQVEDWLSELNMTPEEQTEATSRHLPFGVPQTGNLSVDLTLLYQQDHVAAYSEELKVPLWSSFTLALAPEGSATAEWSSDVRLTANSTVTCQDYDQFGNGSVIMAPLFPPMFSSVSDLSRVPYIVSNALPSTEQQQRHWEELMQHLVLRWLGAGQLNLVVGPVYDNNADSIVDNLTNMTRTPELPSDWFAVVTRCPSGGAIDDCDPLSLDARAFIYPTVQAIDNCLENSEYALEFSSRVLDVQIATGHVFYPSLAYEERTRLETAVHSSLW